jgi:hypothetical protein
VNERGEDTPTKSESLVEEEEEREVTPPSLCPPHITLPLFCDIAGRHVGIMIDECSLKQTRIGTRPSAGRLEGDDHFSRVNGTNSPIRDFVGPIEFGSHHGNHGRDSSVVLVESRGDKSPAQEGLFWSSPVGVLLVCVWTQLSLTRFLFLLYSFLNSKCDFWMIGVIPRLLRLFIGRLHARHLPHT